MKLFDRLEAIRERPQPFSHYTSAQLWNDPHISRGMLDAHLDPTHDAASYPFEAIDRGIDWIADQFGLSDETRVCDFGCGPGLWTTRFAQRGAKVTGIDFSERSLAHARQTAAETDVDIHYIQKDYLEFAPQDRFDLITMVHGDYSVLSPQQRTKLLHTFRTALAPTARALIEVSSMAHFRQVQQSVEYEFHAKPGYWAPGPHHVFTQRFKYEPEQVLCDKYSVAEQDRDLDIYVWTQCYSVESLRAEFEQHGLTITSYYADMAGTPLQSDSRRIMAVAVPA